jgi:hypothetical protein
VRLRYHAGDSTQHRICNHVFLKGFGPTFLPFRTTGLLACRWVGGEISAAESYITLSRVKYLSGPFFAFMTQG